MATKYGSSSMSAMLVVVVIACTATVGESKSAPAPVDCTTVVLGMSDCLSYVTNGSTVEKPEGNCCSGLKSVLKTNAECLCEGFKSSSQFGVVLNVTKALALPGACHVHAPDAAKCGLSLSPTGAPTQSPAVGGAVGVSPTGAPSGAVGADAPSGAVGADTPSGAAGANAPSSGIGGSEVSPALSPGSAGSSSVIGIPVQLIVVGLTAAFFS